MKQNDQACWVVAVRSIFALLATASVTAFAIVLRQQPFFDAQYFWQNRLPAEDLRRTLIVYCVGAAAAILAGCCCVLATRTPLATLHFIAARAAPLGPLAFLRCLFSWRLYDGHDVVFLLLVLADALAIERTLRRALETGLTRREREWLTRLTEKLGKATHVRPDARTAAAAVVCLASTAYTAFFAYNMVVWHRSVRSGFDLAIEDNILWNLLHGGAFFHASPVFGPTGSHFGRHATLISYALLPLYALHQDPETLHVLQAVLLGAAAMPLFLFARRRIGAAPAASIALVYLLHPAIEESNLFEMQYTKLAPAFFWTTLWLLDSGRTRLGVVAAISTLLVREDVASWIFLLGVFIAFSDELSAPRKVGVLLAAVSGAYVAIVKFVIMPSFLEPGMDLVFMYRDLLPQGHGSFGAVLASVFSNPAYTLESLLDPSKVVYLLELLVPLALLPLRRRLGLWALIPGFVYCLLSTKYPPLVDIHYQYSPHVLAFEFPVAVLVLARLGAATAKGSAVATPGLIAALCAMLAAALPCSYQYGAVFQSHTSRGGPIPFKFGWDDEGRARRDAIEKLKDVVPASARVAASAMTVPQFSSRANDYSLSLGIYDADWLVAPTAPAEYVGDELPRTKEALASGNFGVVAVEGPFFVARRGASPERNAELLTSMVAAR